MNEGILKYAPIFWFHKNESYLPIEVKALVEHSDLYKNDKKVPFNKTLEELRDLKNNGKEYRLALPNIELGLSKRNNYLIGSKKGYGFTNLTEEIKEFYKGIKANYKNIIYAKHSTFKIKEIEFDANLFTGIPRKYNSILIGDYDVYQYFPFYFFNDFTNLHIGDWDSTVEIYVNKTNGQTWIRTHAHHYTWLSQMNRPNQYTNINNWIKKWGNHKRGTCDIFNLNKHPFIFVSKGGHGCYPTPGYSVRGIGFKINLPIAFEERSIAKTCLMPKNGIITRNQIKTILDNSEINTQKFRTKQYELIEFHSEPWAQFEGRWGNRSEYKTWDSPTSAPHKREHKITQRSFIKNFKNEYKKGYYTELIINNYHGVLDHQG